MSAKRTYFSLNTRAYYRSIRWAKPTYDAHILTAIREYDAKLVLGYWLTRSPSLSGGKPETDLATPFIYPTPNVAQIAWDEATNTITPDTQTPQWVFTSKLVAKPDQLIKRRGKAGLLALNKTWPEAKEWIAERAGKPVQVRTSIHQIRASLPLQSSFYFCPFSHRFRSSVFEQNNFWLFHIFILSFWVTYLSASPLEPYSSTAQWLRRVKV